MPDRIDFAELERRVREDEDRELSAFLKGTGEAPVIYRVQGDAVKASSEVDGPIEFVCSEESDDRAGDLIHVAGWDTNAFKKNPVMPWVHDYHLAPIGRWSKMRVEGKQLLGLATFDRNDPFAAQIESKYRSRFLNAVSVGFRPLEFKEREERKDAPNPFRRGYEFSRQELLEVSGVSIPMHPKALRKGLALAEGAPVWIFMPGDKPGEFKAVQPVQVQPVIEDLIPKDMAEARQMLDDAIRMQREHMDDAETATTERMREQMRLMRGARRQMNEGAAFNGDELLKWLIAHPIPDLVTTTSTTANTLVATVDLTRKDPDQGAASAYTKDAPPGDGGEGMAELSAVLAELKRVREGATT